MNLTHQSSKKELRFKFGKNWSRFLNNLTESRIQQAIDSLKEKLNVTTLEGQTFLDVGSGSGLFSLAARRLGANVFSFDYDENSVNCTQELKKRYFPDDDLWQVERGDAVDANYFSKFEPFDVVYSWGVLHHTGHMWKALDNVSQLVKPDGKLFIAIYNRQSTMSNVWLKIKKLYNTLPFSFRWIVIIPTFIRLWGPTFIKDFIKLKPFHTWLSYEKNRGMHPWYDFIDWIGGYPFEVAKPEEIFDFYKQKGFSLEYLVTMWDGIGCNEFVFRKK